MSSSSVAPKHIMVCSQSDYLPAFADLREDIYPSAIRNRETFIKTRFQEIGEKEPGITAERDPDLHREIARQLHPAFSARALRSQEPVVHRHVDDFIGQLKQHGTKGRGVDMKEWIDWVSFDIAGDMAYGREFRNTKDGKSALFLSTFQRVGPWGTINQVFKRFPLLHPFVWLLVPPRVVLTVPTLLRLNRQEVRARIARRGNLSHPDYIQHLFPQKGEEKMPSEDWFLAQANVLIVAGFDPITNLLSATVYYLCMLPEKRNRLAAEIRKTFACYDEITAESLQSLQYLQAVINEGLRIHTNAAFGLPRVSPGAVVDGHYVPKGVTVQTCHFTTTHDERNFIVPREFHPERFLAPTHPLYEGRFSSDNRKAFIPFSLGPRGCPGSNSAYMQARIFLAKLVWTFDMELSQAVDWEAELRMYAVWSRPEVWVKFTEVQH
ncbi:hypothetical protein McanCB56680_001040 [Microsporum canis]